STIWTEIHGSILNDINGLPEGIFMICRDVSERKHAEETIRENDLFLKQSQKAALIGSYKIEMVTGIWKSSEEMNQIFGIDEHVEKNIENWLTIVHPDDRENMKSYFCEYVVNQQNPFNKDYRIVRICDGAVRWVHGLGELEIDAHGNVVSMIGTIQDITERKYAEEAVQHAHDELKNLHDNLDEAIFSHDVLNNKMLQASKAHEDIFGYPPSEFYRNPNLWYELIIPEDKPMVDTGFPILYGGKELHHEFRIIRPDGQMRWVAARMQPKMNERGQCIRIDGIAYDITKRKRAEEEIRESEERFRMVFENVFDGIAVYEENDDPFKRRLVECNNQYAIMAGRPREELLSMGYIHHLQRSLNQSNNRIRLESLSRQQAYKGSSSWIRPDGKENVIEYIGVPITWRGKSYSIGIDRDATERMQIEADLIAAKEKAEESDRLKSSFLANMSHEIRTPLNSIIGFSELMSDPDFDREQQCQFAQIIHASGNNLLSIITDIMDISKIEAGLVEVRKNELSAIHLAKSIHRQYAFQAREKGIEFILDPGIPAEEIRLNTDETKLRQIIVNLIGNSIKFTEKGFVELGVRKIDENIQFHVKDTGIGISAAHKDKIFERFRQVESCLSRKYGGNGLGLAISKSLVELLGGKLWMESEEGNGSTFYFTLPLDENKSAS
ncbi:MAG: PAS domain S-box protein, partial [Verrucomicrobia bacterium]|nr:PAS domain S-box protein [Prolixibacteraceae bacterium]